MPRKVVKGTTENLNMLREKVDYIWTRRSSRIFKGFWATWI